MITHACSGIRKYEGSLKGITEIVRPNCSNLRVERKRDGGARPSLRLGSLRSEGHRADNILKSKQDVRGPKPGTTAFSGDSRSSIVPLCDHVNTFLPKGAADPPTRHE